MVSKNYKEECVIGNFTNQKANGLMSMTLDLGDYTEHHMLKHKNEILSEQLVKCRSITLTKLLDNHNFDKIDFLKVDIEGAEIFLKNDILLLKPKYIMLEFDARKTNVQKYIDMIRNVMNVNDNEDINFDNKIIKTIAKEVTITKELTIK